jgi:hypothetical protein
MLSRRVHMFLSDQVVEDFGLVRSGLYFTVDGQNVYMIQEATNEGYIVIEIETEVQA